MKYFISGHLDLTPEEFELFYKPQIDMVLKVDPMATFIIGDARGADTLAQKYVKACNARAVVYHMFEAPRNNIGFETKGGFKSDEERDATMTWDSHVDILWVRPGREKSGTAKNQLRRSGKTI